MDQDKCVFRATPFPGLPPIYVELYVDDFVDYFSESVKVEEWFVNNLKSHVKVGFMDDVQWFLRQCCEWSHDNDGRISYHVSQQAFICGRNWCVF